MEFLVRRVRQVDAHHARRQEGESSGRRNRRRGLSRVVLAVISVARKDSRPNQEGVAPLSIQSDMKRAGIKLTKEQLDQLRSLVAKEKRQREQILKAIRRLIKEKADPKTGRLKYARDLQTYAIL